MKTLVVVAIVLASLVGAGALGIGFGVYDVGADTEHSSFIYSLIETTRERSIAARIRNIKVPDVGNAQQIRRGAGNYAAMCAGCHLTPGGQPTEISRGLYPRPPNLTKTVQSDPARTFWIIKHGVKATGMPAWGKSMEDGYIWDMVAFVGRLPQLSASEYELEVEHSGGHSHGGGESDTGHESHERQNSEHSHDHLHEHNARRREERPIAGQPVTP